MNGFQDVIGQEKIVRYMRNAICHQKILAAYIIQGAKGSGKKMLAKLFAQAAMCENEKDPPCMTCPSCKKTDGNNHPDIVWVKSEKENSIGVSDIRQQINNSVYIKPYNGRKKFYIIPNADTMTIQAQNALLKTLEEPPQYVVICLLAENGEIFLPTITSRCMKLWLSSVPEDAVADYLIRKTSISTADAAMYAAISRGNIGNALELLQSESFRQICGRIAELMDQINELDYISIENNIEEIKKMEIDIESYLDLLATWIRDILIYKATGDSKKIVFQRWKETIIERAKSETYRRIGGLIQEIESAKNRLKANVNYDLVMSLLLLKIKES